MYSVKKVFKRTINNWSESVVFKLFLSFCFLIVFIIAMPFIILSIPFVLAWSLAGAVTELINKNMTMYSVDEVSNVEKSRWGSFMNDLNSWDNKKGNS